MHKISITSLFSMPNCNETSYFLLLLLICARTAEGSRDGNDALPRLVRFTEKEPAI